MDNDQRNKIDEERKKAAEMYVAEITKRLRAYADNPDPMKAIILAQESIALGVAVIESSGGPHGICHALVDMASAQLGAELQRLQQAAQGQRSKEVFGVGDLFGARESSHSVH